MEGRLLCSQPADLSVHLVQKYSHRNTQGNVWPHVGPGGPAKLTHKINPHRGLAGEKRVGAAVNTVLNILGRPLLHSGYVWGATTEMGT